MAKFPLQLLIKRQVGNQIWHEVQDANASPQKKAEAYSYERTSSANSYSYLQKRKTS